MAGTVITRFLLVFCAILVIDYISARPQDAAFPSSNENAIENLEPHIYPQSVNAQVLKSGEKPKNCFHFFVSRNMSSLLADATKMLRTIRDRREREWILTFIYRIKSLAEHLRSHPESRNYDCLPTDDESKKRIFSNDVRGQQQPELYFVDDFPKRSNDGEGQQEKAEDKSSNDNQESSKSSEEQSTTNIPTKDKLATGSDSPMSSESQSENSLEVSKEESRSESDENQKKVSVSKKQDTGIPNQHEDVTPTSKVGDVQSKNLQDVESSIVLSSSPDCDSITECQNIKLTSSPEQVPDNYFPGDSYPMYQSDDDKQQDMNSELYQQEILKLRIRKALLEELAPEIKKLRTVGGTEEDLMRLWNFNQPLPEEKSVEDTETDFDYEETGAAAGDLNLNEKVQPDRTVAPSLDEVQTSKENANNLKDSSYQPYDDSDVLVQQLFDVRYNDPPSKTTKSLNDQNNEYLITSTHIPF